MAILWIEDEKLSSKIHIFNEALHDDCSVDKLEKADFVILRSLSEVCHKAISNNTYELHKQLFDFFNSFDLIFCDMNLTTGLKLEATFREVLENIGYPTEFTQDNLDKAGLAILAWGINAYRSCRKEVKCFLEKFFFLSKYDKPSDEIQRALKSAYNGKDGENAWCEDHFIEIKSINSEFKPSFTDFPEGEKWKSIFSNGDFVRVVEGENEKFLYTDGNGIIYMALRSNGLFEICFSDESGGHKLVQDVNFSLKSAPLPTPTRIKYIFEKCNF